MTLSDTTAQPASVSDGSTASYYELPAGATELQDLISHRNMNAQDGEIFRAIYRKGRASHSDELRDAKKVLFYAKAELERLLKLEDYAVPKISPACKHVEKLPPILPENMPADFGQQHQLQGGAMIHCPDCSADSCPCVSR